MHTDAIFALSSGRGRAGVAVVRVSGPGAAGALRSVAGPELPRPRMATLRKLTGPDGDAIDDGLVLWFPSPASFTGEDVAEFHVHGGRAVIGALLAVLGSIPGLRAAEPGEFTRRAVENGKFDLTQAEALADLVNAETEGQRQQALRQYGGALTTLYEGWRAALIRAAAWVESTIDFSDEEVPRGALEDARSIIKDVLKEIRVHLEDARRGEILRDGFRLTVIGPPNSGKSSLVNALARRDVAIVSEIAGTTRDLLEVHLDLGGVPVIVTDTAGLRESSDPLEAEGIRRALGQMDSADAVLLLLDATQPDQFTRPLSVKPTLTVWNKADLQLPSEGQAISVRTGAGMEGLTEAIRNIVQERMGDMEIVVPTRERHRNALGRVVMALESSFDAREPDLVAEELRSALAELGRITGRVDVEEVLGAVFKEFCVGK
ncbi:MAG: tRNA uridine-5-carboxymethylaminomethyl(34) synthesis GTPase MnmE [Alphaproteobacteria bacterium]|nr:tRNA uridine-5-carboxymethylaminomethyl(34) synthesis GTPase MnmE [Alphaproteobacteria bacterium]